MVHYTNLLAERQVNVFYSTPEAYADAKQAEGVAWTVKTNNFYPYAGNANSYCTGNFTSRSRSHHSTSLLSLLSSLS